MKIRYLASFGCLASLLLLSGCASHSKKFVNLHLKYITTDTAPLNSGDVNAQNQLAESATAVGHSLQQLSAMQLAVHPHAQMLPPVDPKLLHLSQTASISWNGPAEPILARIAEEGHYHLHVLGQQPAIPTLVTLDVHDETLAQIVRDIRYQIHNTADVHIYPDQHVIELRYITP